MRSEQYLSEIRDGEGLLRAVLQKIVVEKSVVTFYLLTDVTYTQEDVRHATKVSEKYVPEGFTAQVSIVKSVPDEEGVRREIAEILRKKFPAAAAFVTPETIEVVRDQTGGRFYIPVGNAEFSRFSSGEILDKVSAELGRTFCGTWFGNVKMVEREEMELTEEALPPAEEVIGPRFFPICNYVAIDGGKPKNAIYLADLEREGTGIAICGTVAYVQEKETKKGKPYFAFSINDPSGQYRLNYFTKKATVEKVREIKEGDSVCFTGDCEYFNGSLSFRAKTVDYGTPPDGFVPEEKASRSVPKEYQCVFPEPTSDLRQAMLFEEVRLPQDLMGKTFVVFDLETTGLNNTPAGGPMDHITELGAVKIVDGKISEKFTSLIACPVKISAEITALTGIDNAMLEGAPNVSDVLTDFYKFCDGAILVGHNVQFDLKFVRHYGEQIGYIFNHQYYDTLVISQDVLRQLSHHKLNNVADHYGFTFNHHRAYDDAFVTAQVFLELIKEKKCLPKL